MEKNIEMEPWPFDYYKSVNLSKHINYVGRGKLQIVEKCQFCFASGSISVREKSFVFLCEIEIYRIVVACRNGTICTLKRGWTEAKVLVMLESQVNFFKLSIYLAKLPKTASFLASNTYIIQS